MTAAIISLIFVGIKPDPNHYFAGSLLQVHLLEKTPSPRIILAGGSNVSLGLDAELMQQRLGIPVINDGLHAGLGLVPLKELQDYIRSGDAIIISLEYSMFSSKGVMQGDRAFLSDWIEYSPQRLKYLSNPWTETPAIYATMLQRKFNRQVNFYLFGRSPNVTRQIFNGTKFNANGDFIGHLQNDSSTPQKIPPIPYAVFELQDDIFVFLEDFNQTALSKGARVYFAAPASRERNCKATGQPAMAAFFETFTQRSSIPLLTPIEDVCMSNRYFFDTEYHLNAEGRRIRTEHLINNWLQLAVSNENSEVR